MSETLRLVPKAKARIDATSIELLTEALQMAKDGRISGVAIVALMADGDNYLSYSAMEDRLKFAGLLNWVTHRLLRKYDEENA